MEGKDTLKEHYTGDALDKSTKESSSAFDRAVGSKRNNGIISSHIAESRNHSEEESSLKFRPSKEHVIAFIPVRGGSKSIPKKNIKSFCGKPLVYWVIQELQSCESVTDIIVATDSNEIEECIGKLQDLRKVSVFKRSEKTSTDSATTESVILEYLNSDTYSNSFPQYANPTFMLVQATSPLTTRNDFEGGLNLFFEKSDTIDCSVLSGVQSKRFTWLSWGIHLKESPLSSTYTVTARPRRQDYDGTMTENGAFYISSVSQIKNDKCRLSPPYFGYYMSEDTLVEIDEPSDWEVAEKLMWKRIHKNLPYPMPDIFFFDVDGVLTDCKEEWSSDGVKSKSFNKRDGAAISFLVNELKKKVFFISTDDSEIARSRCEFLGGTYLYVNKEKGENKMIVAMNTVSWAALSRSCFIGDDLFDMPLLKEVKYAFCPKDAHKFVREMLPNVITLDVNGGDGVVSEALTYFS